MPKQARTHRYAWQTPATRNGFRSLRTEGKTTTERGYGWGWQQQRRRILERDQHLCIPCRKQGIYTPAVEVDHIVNFASGGVKDDGNCQSICKACHREKTQQESKGADAC